MTIAMRDLRLDSLDVLHAGEHAFPIGEGMRAVAVGELLEEIEPLR